MRPTTPSRVLMTTDTVGGVWTYAVELSRELGQAGIEVILASMGALPTQAQRSEVAACPSIRLVESRYRLPWMEQPWDDVESAREWLMHVAGEAQPDLIHLNEPVFGSSDWEVPTLVVVHSCVLSWWEGVWHQSAPAGWNRYRREMERGILSADRVVAPSRWMLRAVQRLYGLRTGSVIPNGRSAEAFTPEPKEQLIFAAGRIWDAAKNLLLLDPVADRLPWPVYIAGDRELEGSGDPVSVQFQHCRTLGRLSGEEVSGWLRRASIYAFPAKYEPFGLSVLEAALAGCALVLSDLPTLRELWDGAAVFVEPDDRATLERVLQSLIENQDLRTALAMRARRRALRLSPHRMAQRYLEIYEGLLSSERTHVEDHACAS